MKMLKMLSLSLSALLLAASLVSCSSDGGDVAQTSTATDATTEETGEESSDAVEPMIFRVGHSFLSTQAQHIAIEEITANITERTNGEIIFEIYPNNELPIGVDGVEQCIAGSYFINVYAPDCLADWVPDYVATQGPMLYETQEEYIAFQQTDFMKNLNAQAEEQGVKVLATDWVFGMRHIGTSKVPVHSVDDIKGLKIRVPNAQAWTETFIGFGAAPIAMSWGEIYNAIQTGVVDGMESSLSDYVDNQFWEVVNYISLDGHFVGNSAVMMSAEIFNNVLTEEQQTIFMEEFTAGSELHNRLFAEAEEAAIATLEENGVELIEPDLTGFQEASTGFYDAFPNLTPGVYDEIMAELETIRNS